MVFSLLPGGTPYQIGRIPGMPNSWTLSAAAALRLMCSYRVLVGPMLKSDDYSSRRSSSPNRLKRSSRCGGGDVAPATRTGEGSRRIELVNSSAGRYLGGNWVEEGVALGREFPFLLVLPWAARVYNTQVRRSSSVTSGHNGARDSTATHYTDWSPCLENPEDSKRGSAGCEVL